MTMLQFTPRVWAAAGAVAAASVGSPAQAVILSYNPTLSSATAFSDAEIGGASSGTVSALPTSLDVEQFDSSLGTLLSIELSWSENFFSFSEGLAEANLASCFIEEGGSGCNYSFGVDFDVAGTLTTPDGTSDLATATGSGSGNAQGDELSPNDFNYVLDNFPSYTSSPMSLGNTPFAPYIGIGDWQAQFNLSVSNIFFFSNCSPADLNSFCGADPNPAGQFWPAESFFWDVNGLQVTYTYETSNGTHDVPEPGMLIPFGLGFGMLALYTVRRQSRKRDNPLETSLNRSS